MTNVEIEQLIYDSQPMLERLQTANGNLDEIFKILDNVPDDDLVFTYGAILTKEGLVKLLQDNLDLSEGHIIEEEFDNAFFDIFVKYIKPEFKFILPLIKEIFLSES